MHEEFMAYHRIKRTLQFRGIERQHSKIRGCYHLLNQGRQHNDAN